MSPQVSESASASASAEIEPRTQLSVVVFTDAVGYSRLAEQDEAAAVMRVQQDLNDLESLCRQEAGRLVKRTGDGALLLFPSPSRAMAFAVMFQRHILSSQASEHPGRMLHRVAMHISEVRLEAGDVWGDGVNVAARLLDEAAPGAICLSSAFYEVHRSKLPRSLAYVGQIRLKNLREPVGIFQIYPSTFAVVSGQVAVEVVDCTHCGYDVRGVTGPVCPECGQAIDRGTVADQRIPWERRGELGSFRAFWMTVLMACLHPLKLATRAQYGISLPNAMFFRTICRLIALVSLLVISVVGVVVGCISWELSGPWFTTDPAVVASEAAQARQFFLFAAGSGILALASFVGSIVVLLAHLRRSGRGPRTLEQYRESALACYRAAALSLYPTLVVVALLLFFLNLRSGLKLGMTMAIMGLCWVFLSTLYLLAWFALARRAKKKLLADL